MTDRISSDSRNVINQTGLMRWKNTSGETIPAYACVKLDSFDTAGGYYNAVKPDGDGNLHFFNGGVTVAANKFGESFIWGTSSVLGLTTGVFNEIVGPTADSWEMTTSGSGFVVFSNPSVAGIAAILKEGGGGGGGSQRIWFVIREVECDIYTGAKTLYVEVKEYTGGNCTSLVPGEDPYMGLVTVEDFCSTLSFFTAEQLLDGTGSATYFWPRGSGYCLPRWLVDDICVVPECA